MLGRGFSSGLPARACCRCWKSGRLVEASFIEGWLVAFILLRVARSLRIVGLLKFLGRLGLDKAFLVHRLKRVK